MKDHLRFSVVYWHTFRGSGADPFGPGTMQRPWDDGSETVENAVNRVRAAFEFLEKLGVPFYAFHDRDVAPEGASLAETNKNLDAVVKTLEQEQERTGIKLLWGTANLFSNPRFMHGASTSCNADAFAYAAAQVKKCLEVTKEFGGSNYVFWGGREGYQNLEHRHEARARPPGPSCTWRSTTPRRSASPASSTSSPSRRSRPSTSTTSTPPPASISSAAYDLADHVKLNIETNHATLAGHTIEHELDYAGMQGFLGSVDANTGDLLLGWDTDQFPTDYYLTTRCMLMILKYGGLSPGGVNFDAKVRRESFEPIDLFHAHIGGMDTFARGLKIAAAIRAEGTLESLLQERYSSWNRGIGAEIESGQADFQSLEKYMLEKGDISPNQSGRQEMLENLINRYF